MEILGTGAKDIERAGEAIRQGLLVALPTETVYGLGANALDVRALARVFEAKERPHFDPLIVHIADPADADLYADMDSGPARVLRERFWPGPLTLVLPRRGPIPDLATSGLPTVAIRCPAHEVARALIRAAGVPVAAPSANPFGRLSPTSARHVARQLGEKVDFIIDGGPSSIGVESTVVDCSEYPPLVLRPGGLSIEALQEAVPQLQVFDRATASPRAPGQLPSHYAPRIPLFLVPEGSLPSIEPAGMAAALCFGLAAREAAIACGRFSVVRCLSENADPIEAAARLFALLHELDAAGIDQIWAERLPELGIGRAVNDRLFKASVK
jgi:L-threonylcarbamoyladenylate synthase